MSKLSLQHIRLLLSHPVDLSVKDNVCLCIYVFLIQGKLSCGQFESLLISYIQNMNNILHFAVENEANLLPLFIEKYKPFGVHSKNNVIYNYNTKNFY